MKVKHLTTLVVLLASVFFFVENLRAQKLKQMTEMYETQLDGFGIGEYDFAKTYCIDFVKNKRVCKGYKIDDGGMSFVIQENEKTISVWSHPDGTGNYTSNFYVFYGDLDKDKVAELVVVSNVNTTNGMGVPSANVYILSESAESTIKKPLVFQIEEFGEKDNFIYDIKNNETLILATEWNSYSKLDLKRDKGLYLVGRWFRYKKGLLEPAFDKPTLARRYLFSFEKERWLTLGDKEWKHRPYIWLRNSTTHKFYKEPKEISKLVSIKYGTVIKYDETSLFENYKSQRKITLLLDSGETVVCSSESPIFEYEREKPEWQNVIFITKFGVLPKRVSLPSEFGPLSVFEKIENKRVRLETYEGKYSSEYTNLWFIEND